MSADPDEPQESPAVSPSAPLVYANAVGARGGPFDISLEFGYVTPPAADEEPHPPDWRVRVVMSWEHAKAMLELLQEHVRAYEDRAGAIPDIAALKIGAQDDDR